MSPRLLGLPALLLLLVRPALATAGESEAEEATPESLGAKLELKRKAVEAVIDELIPTIEDEARVAPSAAQTKHLAETLGELLEAQEEAAQFHRDHPFTSSQAVAHFEPPHPEDERLLRKLTGSPDAQKLAGAVVFNTLQFRRAAAEIEAQRVLYAIQDAGFAMATGKPEYAPPPCPDGSRAPSPGPTWFAGCRFVFQVVEVPVRGNRLRYVATARGVVAPVAGVEYKLVSGDTSVLRGVKGQAALRPPPGASGPPPIIWALRPLVASIPVLDYRADAMTQPLARIGPIPSYPAIASANRVEGLLVFKCVIGADGRVSNCRVIKPLPYTEQVLEEYAARRYQPATFQGVPIDCDYTFGVRMILPKP